MTTEKRTSENVDADSFLKSLFGKDLTFGMMISAIRESEGISLTVFAKSLGISKQNLCDIEKDRKTVDPARAAKWAKILGFPEQLFIQMSLEEFLMKEGLEKYAVEVKTRKAS